MTELNSQTITKVVPALIDARAEFDPVVKDKTNPAFRSKYADLGAVLEAVDPALTKHRLALLQQPAFDERGMYLVTRLYHESGEYLGSHYRLNAVKQDPQGEGSALTYARRYAALALLGIAPEDDDGNAGSQRPGNGNGRSQQAQQEQPADDPASLRARIAAIGKAKGLTPDQIGKHFLAWSEDVAINVASADLLTKYIDHINKASESA